jgi:hypothetical protein
MSFTVVLLITAGLIWSGLVVPWAFSRRFRRAFARVSLRGPFPHGPVIDIALWTLFSLWLVEMGLARPGRWVTLQFITILVTVAAMGVLVLVGWKRRAVGRYDQLRDRLFDAEGESGEKPGGGRGVRSAPTKSRTRANLTGEGSGPPYAAETPMPVPVDEEPRAPALSGGDGRLVVSRPRGVWRRDLLRSFRLDVDGEPRGTVRRGQVLELEVPAGRHAVRARIDWTGSPTLEVDVEPGASVTVVVKPAAGGWSLTKHDDYLNLSVTSSPVS